MKVRLFEIFTSVEGEGILYGTKTLFVRFAGCPFTCFYCDTTEALPMNSGKEYSLEDSCRLIDNHLEEKTYKVNFTGGEPLVQYEALSEMAKYVQSKKIPTYLESSCFDSKKFSYVLPFINYVKIEFKTSDSQFVDEQHYSRLLENALECLRFAVNAKKMTFIKIVISSKTELKPFMELLTDIFKIISKEDLAGFIIQPTHGVNEPQLDKLLKFYDAVFPYYEEVRVIPQLHKLIGAP